MVDSDIALNSSNVNNYVKITDNSGNLLAAEVSFVENGKYGIFCGSYVEGKHYFIEFSDGVSYGENKARELWIVISGDAEPKIELKDNVIKLSGDSIFAAYETDGGLVLALYENLLKAEDVAVFVGEGEHDYLFGVKVKGIVETEPYYEYHVERLISLC